MKITYKLDPITRKLVEVRRTHIHSEGVNKLASVTDDIEAFVSPVDGSVIDTKAKLHKHNAQHNVSNDPDSLLEQGAKQLERQKAPPVDKKKVTEEIVKSFDFVEQNQHLFNSRS